MTNPEDPADQALEELAEADVKWWQRYSHHGEFPWSSVTSVALHLFILLLLAAAAAPLLQYDRTPPAVDVLVVGDEPNAAPGEGDGLPEAGDLAGTDDAEMEPAPEDQEITEVQEVAEPEPFEPEMVVPEAGAQFQEQKQQLQTARDQLAAAKQRLQDALKKGDKARGTGGGGGSGASGKAARAARWVLRFRFSGVEDYLKQIDGLGATLAFPAENQKFRCFYNASAPNPKSEVRNPPNNEINWIDDDMKSVQEVARHLRISSAPFMVLFLPQELEDRLSQLERAYNNLEEDEIASTIFEVVYRNGKYDVIVAEQIPL